MGCGAGKANDVVKTSKNNKPPQIEVRSYNHPDISQSSNEVAIAELKSGIRKNDQWLVSSVFSKYSIPPNESIGHIGYGQTPLHIAAKHNCNNSIRAIIAVINASQPGNLDKFLGIPDSDGNTPAMVAAFHDAPEALAAIFEFSKSFPVDLKNNQGMNLFEIAQNKSQTCINVLNHVFGRQDQPSDNLKSDLLAKQQALVKLQADINAQANSSGQPDPTKKVDPSQTEAGKLQALLIRGNRTAEDVINTQKIQQNQASTTTSTIPLKYSGILAQFSGKTDAYQDPDFPPAVDSICVDKSHEKYEKYFLPAKWLRPHEFLGISDYSQIKLFDNIDPNDIQQGILGVCYFVSSIASIAEYPSRLLKIFNTKESNPNGVYSVTLFNMGIPQEIIVDDKFPCYEWGKPMFTSPKGNELWTLILEKAWAKMFGNYCVTEAGTTTEALGAMLGAPCNEISITDQTNPDKVWADISSWDKEKYIMGCATKVNLDLEKTGLVGDHAYSLLGAYDVGGYRLLKLRNPWGKQEWTGAFSDKSNLWTDEAKRIVGYTEADDGIFCMTVNDFIAMMMSYSVCYHNENYFRTYQEVQSNRKHPEYFEFELKEPSMTNISVLQKDGRFFNKSDGYSESPVEMILLKKEDNQYKYINLNKSDNNYTQLAAGSYALRIKVAWIKGDTGNYGLVTNSEKSLSLKQVNRDKYKDFLKAYLLEKTQSAKNSDIGYNCSFASAWGDYGEASYMSLYVRNDGDGTLDLKITLKQIDNMRIGKRFKTGDGNTFTFNVPPKGYDLQYLKKIDNNGGGSYQWDFATTYN